ncbi:MAG: NAD-dependent 4,6-dehydratase LegB [Pseudomonadota bacterium]
MSRILVTGADGFIGSHVVEALLSVGHDVRAFVQYNSLGSWGWLDTSAAKDSVEVVSGDLRDAEAVADAVRGQDIVLHLGALIAIPYSYRAAQSYIDTNVSGTLNVLQAARRHDAGRVICTSTSEVYGTAQTVPISEDHPLNAQSPYAATKIAADQLALSFARSFGLPVSILRPFNTFGPRQSARAVIPTIMSQIASGARTISLGALTPTRDFTFVTDTAQGFLGVMACDEAVGDVVNIGSGFEISIAETVTAISQAMGRDVEIVENPARLRPQASEVERLWADDSKARRLFGWNPEHGGRDGFFRALATTAQWFSDPANLALYRTEVFVD